MSRVLRLDLRIRVLEAVAGGESHREAAALWPHRSAGRTDPVAAGGDAGHHHQGTAAALIERGHSSGYGTVRRFFERYALTRNIKDRAHERT